LILFASSARRFNLGNVPKMLTITSVCCVQPEEQADMRVHSAGLTGAYYGNVLYRYRVGY